MYFFDTIENIIRFFIGSNNSNKTHFMFLPEATRTNNKRNLILNNLGGFNLERNLKYRVLYLKDNNDFKKIIEEEHYRLKKVEDIDMSFKYRFNNIFKSIVELTNYSNNLSNNNFIETFSTRKILVCRNNIPKKMFKY